MSSKTVWTIIIVTIIILVVAGALYWQLKKTDKGAELKIQVNKAQQVLDETLNTSQAVPKTNPLEQVIPRENPLEKANPFKENYQNPFE